MTNNKPEHTNHQVGQEVVAIGKFSFKKADIFKFVGLVVFIGIMVAVVSFLWPLLSSIFQPGGVDNLIALVREKGAWGVLFLLGLQLVQIIIAFIPGEVVQVAAGIIYGPWIGALVILLGCVISSAIVFALVHWLGAPFVQDMVSEKNMAKFEAFQKSGKLNMIVFILFLIPGLPKDVFTYLVPLTNMRMRTFLIISNGARIPGIVVSTYAASGLVSGDIMQSVVIFLIAAAIALVAILFFNKFTAWAKVNKEYRQDPHRDRSVLLADLANPEKDAAKDVEKNLEKNSEKNADQSSRADTTDKMNTYSEKK